MRQLGKTRDKLQLIRAPGVASRMKRPIWFHRDGRAHWVPCAWQGWAITAVYAAFITIEAVWMVERRVIHPELMALTCIAATAALVVLVACTDDTRRG